MKGAWITKAGLIHSRSEVAVVEVNGKMYVLGGYADGNVAQALNEEYDPGRDMWRDRASLPRGGNHIAAVGLEGKLYAIGGFSELNANAFADVLAYDPATDKWSSMAPLPQPLASMAVVAVDGVIHALGGAEGRSASSAKNSQCGRRSRTTSHSAAGEGARSIPTVWGKLLTLDALPVATD